MDEYGVFGFFFTQLMLFILVFAFLLEACCFSFKYPLECFFRIVQILNGS